MRKLVSSLCVLCILLFAGFSFAAEPEEICFSWTKNMNIENEDHNNTDGYRIYRDPSTNKVFVFPDILQDAACTGTECKSCVENVADGLNHRYVATAYNDEGESDYSQYADVIVLVEKTEIPAIGQNLNPETPSKYLQVLIPIESIKTIQ